jgi:hypothetical protein
MSTNPILPHIRHIVVKPQTSFHPQMDFQKQIAFPIGLEASSGNS